MGDQAELSILKPDDWHLHLRDGEQLASVVHYTAHRFARAMVMPNLPVPVTDTTQAIAYRDRILAALPEGYGFEPLMTLYLTDNLSPQEIARAAASGSVHGVKLYPAGVTTNAAHGVTRIDRIYPALEAMQRLDLPLLVHGEVTAEAVDIFDREQAFIDQVLYPLIRDFPELRIVLEHITTAEAVRFILAAPPQLAATITPHHLLYNRNAILAGGIRPHFYCLPVLKRETHRQALVEAATSANPKFFLGTDSAPHPRAGKETACGCAGIFSAHAAIELYAEVFEQAGALDRLEGFASQFGADFYRLPHNQERIRLIKETWRVPNFYPFDQDRLVPLRAGTTVAWRLAD
ncbi:dihydroorotase [Candidatus Thiosymbion oneisti]|uniref:dihydroorotase n=1 Tax=Candidatus Thiosymbion oneisti TaxID=589554 RepID=UPI000B198679|nr:dihydroorotase [Candidatus Thiosymbion oneisti]